MGMPWANILTNEMRLLIQPTLTSGATRETRGTESAITSERNKSSKDQSNQKNSENNHDIQHCRDQTKQDEPSNERDTSKT